MTREPAGAAAGKPWWLAIGVAAIGAFWLYGATLLPQTAAYARIGPGLYLTIAGLGLIGFGLLLAVEIARGERFEPQDSEDVDAAAPAHLSALLTVVAGVAIPLYAMQRVGFVATAALVFALTARALGSRRLVFDLAIGAALGVIAWYGFSLLGLSLGDAVRLPRPAELLPTLTLR